MRFASIAMVAPLALALVAGFAGPAPAAGEIKVTWIGHATFEVVSPGGTTLLLAPFILKNPKTPAIAKASGAKVVGASDHVRTFKLPKGQGLRGNPGGKVKVGDVVIHFVPAMHSSTPGGRPVGFVLEFADGRTLYDTGDTGIFGDMELIQELHAPNIILLQAGGGPFNQDPKAAALAIKKYFKPDVIVPMHYGTFGILSDEAEVRAALGADSRVKMMQPGETAMF